MPRNIKGKYPTYKSAATGREMRVPGMKMAQDGDPGQAFIEKANTNNVGEETKYMGNVGQDTQLSDAEIKMIQMKNTEDAMAKMNYGPAGGPQTVVGSPGGFVPATQQGVNVTAPAHEGVHTTDPNMLRSGGTPKKKFGGAGRNGIL
tara:strand:+ start:1527 stop:1967 length:441 start_codon:yes stop_codon:yes gene_type:complete